MAAVLAGAVMAAAIVTYRRVGGTGRSRDRVVLTALRMAALALVLFCLFRPTLVVRAAVPQQNVVAVLLDDSRSMQIPDWNGQPRGSYLTEQFGTPDSPLIQALSDRFLVRVFRFSSTAGRLESASDLNFNGSQTRLAAALDGAREELAGLPVSGIVLVSDGADTGDASMADALLGLKAQQLPVYTVGVGSTELPRDIKIDRVNTPRVALKDASLLVDVTVTQTGYAGRTVTIYVEDEGRIVGSEELLLPADGRPATVQVRAAALEAGPRLFKFRVAPLADEMITQNNVRETLIDVRDGQQPVSSSSRERLTLISNLEPFQRDDHPPGGSSAEKRRAIERPKRARGWVGGGAVGTSHSAR